MSPKILATTGGVIDPVKMLLASLITMQNLIAVSHTVCTRLGDPKILRMLGPCPRRMG